MYLDLSYQGRHAAERLQIDNGKLPHGGYTGSKRHPPCQLSFARGVDFQQQINQEIERILWEEELISHGVSPSWAIQVHMKPSNTDESALMTKKYLSSSKFEQTQGASDHHRISALSVKSGTHIRKNRRPYYRPNSTHQFLTATDLRNCAEGEVNVEHGRPTRTTLLRAQQRRHSVGANVYHTRRDFMHRLYEIRNSSHVNETTGFIKFETAREGEPLHSYLTGTRYNRYNPVLGCCFTELKGQVTGQKEKESDTSKQRPFMNARLRLHSKTAPSPRQTSMFRAQENSHSIHHCQDTALNLSVVGNTLSAARLKKFGLILPNLHTRTVDSARYSKSELEDTYKLESYSLTSASSKPDNDVLDPSGSHINKIVVSSVQENGESSKDNKNFKGEISILENDTMCNTENSVNKMCETSVRVPSIHEQQVTASLQNIISELSHVDCARETPNDGENSEVINKFDIVKDLTEKLEETDTSSKTGLQDLDKDVDETERSNIEAGGNELNIENKEKDLRDDYEEDEEETHIENVRLDDKNSVDAQNKTIQDEDDADKYDNETEDNDDIIKSVQEANEPSGEDAQEVSETEAGLREEDDDDVESIKNYDETTFFITEENNASVVVASGED